MENKKYTSFETLFNALEDRFFAEFNLEGWNSTAIKNFRILLRESNINKEMWDRLDRITNDTIYATHLNNLLTYWNTNNPTKKLIPENAKDVMFDIISELTKRELRAKLLGEQSDEKVFNKGKGEGKDYFALKWPAGMISDPESADIYHGVKAKDISYLTGSVGNEEERRYGGQEWCIFKGAHRGEDWLILLKKPNKDATIEETFDYLKNMKWEKGDAKSPFNASMYAIGLENGNNIISTTSRSNAAINTMGKNPDDVLLPDEVIQLLDSSDAPETFKWKPRADYQYNYLKIHHTLVDVPTGISSTYNSFKKGTQNWGDYSKLNEELMKDAAANGSYYFHAPDLERSVHPLDVFSLLDKDQIKKVAKITASKEFFSKWKGSNFSVSPGYFNVNIYSPEFKLFKETVLSHFNQYLKENPNIKSRILSSVYFKNKHNYIGQQVYSHSVFNKAIKNIENERKEMLKTKFGINNEAERNAYFRKKPNESNEEFNNRKENLLKTEEEWRTKNEGKLKELKDQLLVNKPSNHKAHELYELEKRGILHLYSDIEKNINKPEKEKKELVLPTKSEEVTTKKDLIEFLKNEQRSGNHYNNGDYHWNPKLVNKEIGYEDIAGFNKDLRQKILKSRLLHGQKDIEKELEETGYYSHPDERFRSKYGYTYNEDLKDLLGGEYKERGNFSFDLNPEGKRQYHAITENEDLLKAFHTKERLQHINFFDEERGFRGGKNTSKFPSNEELAHFKKYHPIHEHYGAPKESAESINHRTRKAITQHIQWREKNNKPLKEIKSEAPKKIEMPEFSWSHTTNKGPKGFKTLVKSNEAEKLPKEKENLKVKLKA